MEGMELLCFQIISYNGSARSSYVEAITAAKEGDFEQAADLMKDGEANFVEGHKIHAQIIQKEAAGEDFTLNLLLLHAEDQLMSAETLKIVATELIDVYKRLAQD